MAADWITRYEQHNTNAMCDLINFVLKCTGCDLQVDVHDIEDPDNVTSKLTDLQDEYQRRKPTDYPLISRAKGNAGFRHTMTGFFHSLISTAHATGILYSDMAMIENIEVWTTTMSSSAIRPFRHTATVVSLAIGTTLCGLATENAESIAKTMRQKDGEQKKKTVNKERVVALQARVIEGEKKRAATESILTDLFDTVYVHRYRDVDPKIRVDCVAALGTWITVAPDIFFGGQYLRYLGWVLSDTSAPTRAEVIKQLTKLYKNKEDVGRLRAFTERFRPRLVEMATRDAEAGIRAATVDLLDLIRETGLLEPDDIDAIGRLVFDTEPRVRKAVAGFFAENINDLFESALEELGGEEGLAEVIGEEVEDEYNTPRIAWLKLKCLAEVLRSYDSEDEESQAENGSMNAPGVDSRFSLAAQAIYDGIPEVKDWEVLAGYLLYDHSSATQDANDTDVTFKARCQLDEREEILLLEVLNVAVKSRLTEAVDSEKDKKGKNTKARKEESREIQETTALHLAQSIPPLLKKFGANPATASAVLRLEHVLNLEIFQELRQDSTTYAALLDDINKQFMTHVDQGVLAEASTALLHARSFEDLEEVTEEKVTSLWEDVIATFRSLEDARARGNSDDNLAELTSTVRRIANLASISDPVALLDSTPHPPSKKGKASANASTATPFTFLLDLISSFGPSGSADEESDELVLSAIQALLFHHMWLVRSLQSSLTTSQPIRSLPDPTPFAETLLSVINTRQGVDPVRLAAAGTYLDLHTLFATFRHLPSPLGKQTVDIHSLVRPIHTEAQSTLLKIFSATEKAFAKKSRKKLETPVDAEVDLASEPEDLESEDDEDGDARTAEVLKAEKALCELAGKLVLAVLGRVFHKADEQKVRALLTRNKASLGSNYKEIVNYLEEKKPKRATAKAKPKGKSEEAVVEDQEEEEEEQVMEEGGEEDLRNRELGEGEPPEPEEDVAAAPPADEEGEDDVMGD